MSWFTEWFNEHYLDLYQKRDNKDAVQQFKLIEENLHLTSHKFRHTLLDVGCGMGRYVKIFHENEYWITGIDLSESLISLGKKNHPELDLQNRSLDDLIKEGRKYSHVLSLFTSFGYYDRHKDNLQMLGKMTEVLEPKGILWLDFLNAYQVVNQPLIDTISKVDKPDEIKYFREERKIVKPFPDQPRVEKTIYLNRHAKDGNSEMPNDHSYDHSNEVKEMKEEVKEFKESVRLYTRTELADMFNEVGLTIKGEYGDYLGEPITRDSPRTIIWGQK